MAAAAAETLPTCPETLLLKIYAPECLQRAGFSLFEVVSWSQYVETRNGSLEYCDARVCRAHCADDTPVARLPLLRDVTSRRAELPGFGLVPAEWIPADVRRREEVAADVWDAPDLVAAARMALAIPQQSAALSEAATGAALSRFEEFFLEPDGEAFLPATATAALELCLHVLRKSYSHFAHVRVLTALFHTARLAVKPLPEPLVRALLPLVLVALDDVTFALTRVEVDEADEAIEARAVWAALSWLFITTHADATRRAALRDAGGAAPLARAAEWGLGKLRNEAVVPAAEFALEPPMWWCIRQACYLLVGEPSHVTCSATLDRMLRTSVAVAELAGTTARGSDSPNIVEVALAVLAGVLTNEVAKGHAHTPTPRLRAACALLAASCVPRLAVQSLTEAPANPDRLKSALMIWNSLVLAASAWPGGAPALAKLAEEAGVVRQLGSRNAAFWRAATLKDGRQVAARLESQLLQLTRDATVGAAAVAASDAAAAALPAEEEAEKAAASRRADAKARNAAVAASDAAAAALLAEEEAEKAAASRRAHAKARKAERKAEERRARAEAEAAAAAAQQAAEEEARQAAAAAMAEQQQRQVQARRGAQTQQRREAPPQPQPPPPPLQPRPPPPSPPVVAPMERASDELIAQLFPWTAMHADASRAGPVQRAAAAAPLPSKAHHDDDDDVCCVICLDAQRDTALQPCGHGVLCAACAAKVLAKAQPTCPMCRAPASSCSSSTP